MPHAMAKPPESGLGGKLDHKREGERRTEVLGGEDCEEDLVGILSQGKTDGVFFGMSHQEHNLSPL